jgi:hypothetical protein
MKKSEVARMIKQDIRASQIILHKWKSGEISYGRMAELLSQRILNTTEKAGMLPPFNEENSKVCKYLTTFYYWDKESE